MVCKTLISTTDNDQVTILASRSKSWLQNSAQCNTITSWSVWISLRPRKAYRSSQVTSGKTHNLIGIHSWLLAEGYHGSTNSWEGGSLCSGNRKRMLFTRRNVEVLHFLGKQEFESLEGKSEQPRSVVYNIQAYNLLYSQSHMLLSLLANSIDRGRNIGTIHNQIMLSNCSLHSYR